jgi:hypothetical protein
MTPKFTRAKGSKTIPRVYTFTVVGDDQFPVDQLRYDLCYPRSERDSHEIERSFRPRERQQRRITLASSKHPTEERWGSFGWLVESVE